MYGCGWQRVRVRVVNVGWSNTDAQQVWKFKGHYLAPNSMNQIKVEEPISKLEEQGNLNPRASIDQKKSLALPDLCSIEPVAELLLALQGGAR